MGVGAISGIGSGYSVFSVYGNPKSIEKVSAISEDTKAASPLVVVKEEQDVAKEIERNIDDVVDYEEVMKQMLGTQPLNAYTVPTESDVQAGFGNGDSYNDISAYMRNKAIMAYS